MGRRGILQQIFQTLRLHGLEVDLSLQSCFLQNVKSAEAVTLKLSLNLRYKYYIYYELMTLPVKAGDFPGFCRQ